LAGFFVLKGAWSPKEARYFATFDLIISYMYDPERVFQSNVAQCSKAQFVAGPHRPDESMGVHATHVLLRPLEVLGVIDADPRPRLILPDSAKPRARPSLAVHPGSGSRQKNWPDPKWAELLQRLAASTAWHFLLIGGEAEGARWERLAAMLPPDRTHLAQNLPLVQLAQTTRSCAAFIGHDSGITHLAAALDLPGLVLWGPSNEAVWRPVSDRFRILRDPAGLDALGVDAVFREAQSLLNA
jgi:heptosyltransferase-3